LIKVYRIKYRKLNLKELNLDNVSKENGFAIRIYLQKELLHNLDNKEY
jgi:hypothetical protein